MNAFDFTKGKDFSGLTDASGVDHNTLVDLATPYQDSAEEGKGINLWTLDSALNVPRVPDPTAGASYSKWNRYIWIRVPYPGATDKTPKLYVWNDDAPSIATYLRWKLYADLTSINATVAALNISVTTASSNAANALVAANAANASAASANSKATSAETNATNAVALVTAAQADATTSLANAATAQSVATTAKTTADTATTNLATLDSLFTAFKTVYTVIESPAVALPSVGGLVASVVLGYRPRHVQWVLVIDTAHGAFDAGDEIDVNCIHMNIGNPYCAFEPVTTATGIKLYLNYLYIFTSRGLIDYTKCSVKAYYAKQY